MVSARRAEATWPRRSGKLLHACVTGGQYCRAARSPAETLRDAPASSRRPFLIPAQMIAVSYVFHGWPYSHVYGEHSSLVKFVERNWKLRGTRSERSRDTLPNPVQDEDNEYVLRNMPAIGDLFDLFNLDRHDRD